MSVSTAEEKKEYPLGDVQTLVQFLKVSATGLIFGKIHRYNSISYNSFSIKGCSLFHMFMLMLFDVNMWM